MASSYLEVGSAGLITLKEDLIKLSQSLHEVYELMNADMRQVGEAWRDGKYEEFVSGYRPQINRCEEIAQRYEEWCHRVLEPAIDECIEIETTDVGGDGGGSTGGASAAGGGQTAGSADAAPQKPSKLDAFRRGIQKAKELNNLATAPRPQGSGFATPQNERPHLSPQLMQVLLNGKQR